MTYYEVHTFDGDSEDIEETSSYEVAMDMLNRNRKGHIKVYDEIVVSCSDNKYDFADGYGLTMHRD